MTRSAISRQIAKITLGTSVLLGCAAMQPAFAQAAFNLSVPAKVEAKIETSAAAELKPISANSRDLFFSGESNFREFSFYALPEETTGNTELVLTMQSAISNTPDQSRMTVYVNDVEVGAVPISGEPRTIKLPIQPGLIQPGFNAVTFLLDQFHRVDCSVTATYELWTQIDPKLSGFSFASKAKGISGLADLASVARANNGRTEINALFPAGSSMKTADMLVEVIEAISVAGRYDHPNVTFETVPGKGPGIDVVIGTPETIHAMFSNDPALSSVGPGTTVSSAPDQPDRIRLVIAGRTSEEIGRQITTLRTHLSQLQNAGTPQGLRALSKLEGFELGPGSRVSFADLGIDLRSFTGRYFQQSVNFKMPNDFYPGDYGKALVRLNALYAAGLSDGAELLINLNDYTVSNIPLGASRNGVITEKQLPIPFSAFRPGENTFTVVAKLPAPSDEVCDPTRVGGGAGRLRILGDSYLELPDFARIGRYPDLAALNSQFSEFEKRADLEPLAVLVPDADLSGLGAAGTFFAKLAYASNTVFETRFATTLPIDETVPLVAFGSYDSLPFDFLRKMNIDFSLSPSGPTETAAAGSQAFAPFSTGVTTLGLDDQGLIVPPSTAEESFIEHVKWVARDYYKGVSSKATEYFDGARKTAYTAINMVRANSDQLTAPVKAVPPFSPSAAADMVIAQRENSSGEATWTLIASKRSDDLHNSVLTLTHRSVWSRLGGTVQSISTNGEVVDAVNTKDNKLFFTQPSNASNIMLVLAAWLSNHTEGYVFAVMGTFGFLGLSTHQLLRQGRKRRGGKRQR